MAENLSVLPPAASTLVELRDRIDPDESATLFAPVQLDIRQPTVLPRSARHNARCNIIQGRHCKYPNRTARATTVLKEFQP